MCVVANSEDIHVQLVDIVMIIVNQLLLIDCYHSFTKVTIIKFSNILTEKSPLSTSFSLSVGGPVFLRCGDEA